MMKVYSGMAMLAVAAVIGGSYAYTVIRTETACNAGAVAGGGAAIGGPFELVNAAGETVTDKDVIDGPTLIYFGYTFCPDVCPLDAARNALAVDVLAEQGYDVTPVFISIDPERDTPEIVGDFAYNLHPDMIGLTGSPEQVKAASQAYRTYYARGTGDDDYYLVDHSTFSYLMFPDTGLADYYDRNATPEEIAERASCLIDAA